MGSGRLVCGGEGDRRERDLGWTGRNRRLTEIRTDECSWSSCDRGRAGALFRVHQAPGQGLPTPQGSTCVVRSVGSHGCAGVGPWLVMARDPGMPMSDHEPFIGFSHTRTIHATRRSHPSVRRHHTRVVSPSVSDPPSPFSPRLGGRPSTCPTPFDPSENPDPRTNQRRGACWAVLCYSRAARAALSHLQARLTEARGRDAWSKRTRREPRVRSSRCRTWNPRPERLAPRRSCNSAWNGPAAIGPSAPRKWRSFERAAANPEGTRGCRSGEKGVL